MGNIVRGGGEEGGMAGGFKGSEGGGGDKKLIPFLSKYRTVYKLCIFKCLILSAFLLQNVFE